MIPTARDAGEIPALQLHPKEEPAAQPPVSSASAPAAATPAPPTARKAQGAEQLTSSELASLSSGPTAHKLRLADQYRMSQQGDVARRMGLQNAVARTANIVSVGSTRGVIGSGLPDGHHRDFYRGNISPAFEHGGLPYFYWGRATFTGTCWYPTWSPWVQWCWRQRCQPFWDPRPICCRPAIYDLCSQWAWWDVPEWTALPAVDCGTWVDTAAVVVLPIGADLQLLAVRFVDPGHPQEHLGPRYRVWFRNNGTQPITHPFNVVLLAANDEILRDDLPQAGVRVTGLRAGETQSVDIRLPFEVYMMNGNARPDQPPFTVLHVLVDANREVADVARENNGARLNPAEILPVDPAAFVLEPAVAKPGDEVLLAGEGFGPQPGELLLHVQRKRGAGGNPRLV